ncbi:hypothetical protein MIMGU_mgv1a001523mg [Erythranthe guttata]|uniref:non-specific serine/threonine protein kinase n=1 Tax=Erythranthe guttata TaxID=4155 RepID=A0A022QKS5_ERYGU|nr:hypothetical protein MIMGU_mgv1a001523mg [Erythranthe guttata]
MSKVKHFLRKLHIGDHHHGRPPAVDPEPPAPPPQPLTSTSPPPDLPETAVSSGNESSNDASNFNFIEEEFQMQLALAISVSDPGQNYVDSETAQINAAKQISLGCSPSQNLAEFLSFRYSSYNVVNYDEKVIDGFFDVCGIDSNQLVQTKMPSLTELEAISALDSTDCEVVLVNRSVDVQLQQLEEKVYFMYMECHTLGTAVNTSFLVQKIANLIVERMGGPVSDVEEMFRRWRARNLELRIYLNTIALPLGFLDIGHSRHRALLFKVLADRINLPCKLVKGSYYTGTDEGAVNLVKLDDGSEYIIDLMGSPGTLIPAEAPSGGHHQNSGVDAKSIATVAGSEKNSCTSQGARNRLFFPSETSNSSSESSSIANNSNRKVRRITGNIQTELSEHEVSDLYLPSTGKEKSTRWNSHIEDASNYATRAAKEPEFARELDIISLENCAVDLGHADMYLSNEHSLVPVTGLQLSCSSSRKRSADGLGAHLFKLELEGHKSSFSIPGKENALGNDRNDEVISNGQTAVGRALVEFSQNTEATLMSCTDKYNASKIHNPVLNGVAEILWEDLQIGERIGIGSYGEVYRAEWNGTEVAVKKFMKQDISDNALAQFKCEVEIMLRLRHPNVVLFMGAVTCPPNMSILTEFLPRLRGMNYLHSSHPIIVHRDLKTLNLLVDKNWVVKVCDFGMSRLQHHTFLSSKSAAGTAEWMAPEVLRSEPSNEKSDVYSFGVILWELATLQVPWTEMNSMQVVGAVGFQNRRLEIPPIVDPLVSNLISDCWNTDPQARPSFAQIITRLKCLHCLTVNST